MKGYSQNHAIRVNQIGYISNDVKTAFIANKNATTFEIKDAQTDETVYELIQDDYMHITVNEEDFRKMGIDYIYADNPLTADWTDSFTLLYEHNGAYLYKVNWE